MAVNCVSQEDKERIFRRYHEGTSIASLGRMYAVSTRTIGRIINEMKKDKESSSFSPTLIDVLDDMVEWDDDDDDDDDWDNLTTDEIRNAELYAPKQESEEFYKFIMAPGSITVIKVLSDGDTLMETIDDKDDRFQDVYEDIFQTRGCQETLKNVFMSLSYKARIESMSFGNVVVHPETNELEVACDEENVRLSGKLVDRVIEAVGHNDKSKVASLINFADRLACNPSYRAVTELYDFLEAKDINITEYGMVECYKRVREDFTDCHSGTFDNSVGKLVSMPRNQVDENPNNTCSRGLHVASRAYLPHFRGAKYIKVHVDPADFVAIPDEYYSVDDAGDVKAKARVCRYLVVEDITDQFV